MPPLPATDALRLILAVVPWIVDHPGTPVVEVAERFGKTEEELLAAIGVISFVGLPPYSPDVLIEMRIDEGRIWIEFASYFSKPLRLSTRQGLALLSSADGLLSVPGNDPEGSLATALRKVATAVGANEGRVEVELGEASSSVLDCLKNAVAQRTEVKMEYFSFGRNQTTTRLVAPWKVYADAGAWYVRGWCQSAEGERTFRVDRISAVEDTGAISDVDVPDDLPAQAPVRYRPTGGEDTITLEVEASARWIIESLPSLDIEELGAGRFQITLAVSAVPWLERLLLQLGPDAAVIRTSVKGGASLRPQAALRLLGVYNK